MDVGSVCFQFGLDVESSGFSDVGESFEGLCCRSMWMFLFQCCCLLGVKLPRYLKSFTSSNAFPFAVVFLVPLDIA